MHAIASTSLLTPVRALAPRRVPSPVHSAPSPEQDSFRRLQFGKDADQENTRRNAESPFDILFRGRANQKLRRFLQKQNIHTFDDFETQIVQMHSHSGDAEDWYRVASVIRHGDRAHWDYAEKIYARIIEIQEIPSPIKAMAQLCKAKMASRRADESGLLKSDRLALLKQSLTLVAEAYQMDQNNPEIKIFYAHKLLRTNLVPNAIHFFRNAVLDCEALAEKDENILTNFERHQLENLSAIKRDAFAGLGHAYRKDGQFSKAINAYQEALNLANDVQRGKIQEYLDQTKAQLLNVEEAGRPGVAGRDYAACTDAVLRSFSPHHQARARDRRHSVSGDDRRKRKTAGG